MFIRNESHEFKIISTIGHLIYAQRYLNELMSYKLHNFKS